MVFVMENVEQVFMMVPNSAESIWYRRNEPS